MEAIENRIYRGNSFLKFAKKAVKEKKYAKAWIFLFVTKTIIDNINFSNRWFNRAN